jgi:hypothetical protein
VVAMLALLLVVPWAAAHWSRRRNGSISWSFTGAAFGSIVAPASLGLYGTFFLGPVFVVTGLIGLLLTMLHGTPGYYLCIWLGLLPARTVITGSASIPMEVANGLIWGVAYGLVGFAIDRLRCSTRT